MSKVVSMLELSLKELNKAPQLPGVYMFLNQDGEIIYVGKAKNLKNRLVSYKHVSSALYPKTALMLSEARRVKVLPTLSELEAFILEQNLIRQFTPMYNIKLKDDSSYPYIVIQRKKAGVGASQVEYTRVFISRNPPQGAKKIGPFADASQLKSVLRELRKIFPYADCPASRFVAQRKKGRACIYGQIGLCPAPCVNPDATKINEQNIKDLESFILRGQSEITRSLDKRMRKLAADLQFEEAQKIRDTLIKINQLHAVNILQSHTDQAPMLPEDVYRLRVKQVIEFFGLSPDTLDSWHTFRIECYDISNLMGQAAVGGMVVSVGGQLRKGLYRRFKVRTVDFISDVDMMYEVIYRRLSKHDKAGWELPHLLMVDGGRTQLKAAARAVHRLGLEGKFLLVSIFKPNDDFYVYKNGRAVLYKVKERNIGIEHLRQLRDEAHRYSKQYHKKVRLKEFRAERPPL